MTTAAETEAARTRARPVSRSRAFRRTPLGRALVKVPLWILIVAIFIYALFPFYWALRSAFMPANELFSTPIKYLPTDPTLAHFREVLGSSFFRRALLNSTIVAGHARGRGLGARIARLLAEHAFALRVQRVAAYVNVGNVASERVLERAGYTREGVVRSMPKPDGRRVDKTLFSLLPGE